MSLNVIMSPHPVTIEEIIYIIDKFGIISPSIRIKPPLRIHMFNNSIIEQSLIHLNPFMESEYNNIFKGSEVNIFKTPDKRFILEIYDNSNRDTNIPLFPKTCPSCGNILRNYNGQCICNNIFCPTQILERCVHFIKSIHMQLHGIYYQIFCMLVSKGYIKNLIDIFTISESTITSIKNITEKQAKIFKLLTTDRLGKVSMIDFLHGLCIFTGIDDDIDILKQFVYFQNKKTRMYNKLFDISEFIELIDNTINTFNLYISNESNNAILSILDQLHKLSDFKMNALREMYGIVNLYSLACIIDYATNSNNRDMLNSFAKLNIIGYDI